MNSCDCGARRMPYRWHDDGCSVMTPATVARVPNTPGTPRRTIRVPDALWLAAAEKAKERGEDLSAVLRKALERYVKRR
jgi:hypothetical protein